MGLYRSLNGGISRPPMCVETMKRERRRGVGVSAARGVEMRPRVVDRPRCVALGLSHCPRRSLAVVFMICSTSGRGAAIRNDRGTGMARALDAALVLYLRARIRGERGRCPASLSGPGMVVRPALGALAISVPHLSHRRECFDLAG